MKYILILLLFFSISASAQIGYIQRATVTSGTITVVDSQTDLLLIHEAASLSATLTIAFPATPKDGQKLNVSSALGITALTLSTPVGSIVNAITTLIAGGAVSYTYSIANNKWYKTSN